MDAVYDIAAMQIQANANAQYAALAAQEAAKNALIWGVIIGLVVGLIPLIFAVTRQRTDIGVGSFLLCVVTGFIGGIFLAIPMAVVMLVVIASKTAKHEVTTNIKDDHLPPQDIKLK